MLLVAVVLLWCCQLCAAVKEPKYESVSSNDFCQSNTECALLLLSVLTARSPTPLSGCPTQTTAFSSTPHNTTHHPTVCGNVPQRRPYPPLTPHSPSTLHYYDQHPHRRQRYRFRGQQAVHGWH